MSEWIKFPVGSSTTVIPLSFEDNFYNDRKDGYKYTCQNGIMFKASDTLHGMIQEHIPNQGIGQSISIGKISVTNDKGQSFTPFTLNGKTKSDLEIGGSLPNGGGQPPQQSNVATPQPSAPQVTPQVTEMQGGGSSLEQRIATLEQAVKDLQVNASVKELF